MTSKPFPGGQPSILARTVSKSSAVEPCASGECEYIFGCGQIEAGLTGCTYFERTDESAVDVAADTATARQSKGNDESRKALRIVPSIALYVLTWPAFLYVVAGLLLFL